MDKKNLQNRIVHSLFEVTVVMKGINGLWEIVVGLLFLFFKTATIDRIILSISGYGLVQRSSHFTSNYLMRQAQNFSLNTKYYLAFYFLFYGVINILLVILLSQGKLWAYPMAMTFFSLFIVYQVYRYFLYHSGLLLVFIILDAFLVVLTWLEYQRLKESTAKKDILL